MPVWGPVPAPYMMVAVECVEGAWERINVSDDPSKGGFAKETYPKWSTSLKIVQASSMTESETLLTQSVCPTPQCAKVHPDGCGIGGIKICR
jgi:hypothetical protein